MKKYIKSAFANRGYVFTIGALQSVCIGSMRAKIYDSHSEEVVWDGYFKDALKTYPWLADCIVDHLQARGPQNLSIETFVPSEFKFEPAW